MKIYVLIDFSDYSNVQIKLANQWCLKFGYEMVLVHEINLMIPSLVSPDIRLQLEYAQKLEVFQKIIKLQEEWINPSVHVSIEVTAVPLIKFLKEDVQLNIQDLILTGIKGTGVLKQILIGSMVTKLIEEVNQTTISLPLHLDVNVPKTLVIAAHYKSPVHEAALHHLLFNIKESIDYVEFVTVISSPSEKYEAEAYLLALKKNFEEQITCKVNSFTGDDALEDLKNYVLPKKGVFLVLQKGSRSLADRVFRKFMVNEMVYDASIPLIILPV